MQVNTGYLHYEKFSYILKNLYVSQKLNTELKNYKLTLMRLF